MNSEIRDRLTHKLREEIRAHSHIYRSTEDNARMTAEFERLQFTSGRDVLFHSVCQEPVALHEMHAALRRLENDEYGLCLSCEDEISIKRLSALPWVSYCVECQEALERKSNIAGVRIWPEVA